MKNADYNIISPTLTLIEDDEQLTLFEPIQPKVQSKKIVSKSSKTNIELNNGTKYIPIKALAHTPPYKIHKYFARRPWNVFEQIIQKYSTENDIILDPFCGGGVSIYEGLKQNRKVIGCDLNPLSIFVIQNMVKKPQNFEELDEVFQLTIDYLESLYEDFYKFDHATQSLTIEWCELAFEVECHICKNKTLLTNENKVKNGYYRCSNDNCLTHQNKHNAFAAKNCERIGYEYLEAVGYNGSRNKVVHPLQLSDNLKIEEHLAFLEQLIEEKNITIPYDKIPLNWDRQFEDGLKQKGIIHFQHFFTHRNLLINTLLLEFIKGFEPKISKHNYGLLRIAFSNTVKDTNIMSFTNSGWQGGKPTTWSKHAYWIPSQFCEVNILSIFKKSIKRVRNSLTFNQKQKYSVTDCSSFEGLKNANTLLFNQSIADSTLLENSIDAIITDPPYGSNVQYLELSHFWYVWNKDLYGRTPDFRQEAVSNRKKNFEGAKSMYDYEDNLLKVFEKSYQVLKPEKYMVLTFNNKDISAWLALLFSIFKAGFSLEKNGLYFQDGVKNYKQTAHTKFNGSPYGDFIYVFKKASVSENSKSYHSEVQFIEDLDSLFKSYLKQEMENHNALLKEMFLAAIPLIEAFSKTYLCGNSHQLYGVFKKDYLKKLYQ